MTPRKPNRRRQGAPFQYSIRRLMVLTTVVAIVVGVAWSFDFPELFRAALAVYFLTFAVWAVVRGPRLYADLRRLRAEHRRLAQRRARLEREYGEPKSHNSSQRNDNASK
jgi:hypothetical protein